MAMHYLVSGCLNPNIDEFLKRMECIGNTQTTVKNHVDGIIKTSYKEFSEMLHSKTDRDLLTALLTRLTSVNFVTTKLKGSSSKREARNDYPYMVQRYDRKTRSQVVRNDMTGAQQRLLTKRRINKNKATVLKGTKLGRGRMLKSKEYPELGKVIELAFGHGLEIHPRLTESTRYRAPDCAMLM